MRICMFTDSFLPYTSGVTFAVVNQARELAARGHEVSIFRPKPEAASSQDRGELPQSVRVFDVPLSMSIPRFPSLRLTLPSFLTSFSRLKRLKPDVVHVSTEWGCGWEGMVVSKLLGVPLVGTFHTFFADPGYLKAIGLPTHRFLRWLMWTYSVFFYNRCRYVTSPSQSVRDALLDHGIKNSPIVLSNGIQQPSLRSREAVCPMREELGLRGPVFVYFGRVSPEKSLDVVLRAFKKACVRCWRARLVIIGDGPSIDELKRQAADLQLTRKVHFLGHIPHERLISENLPLIGDVFVTASKTENQPLSLMEAMAYGLPILGAKARGIPELVRDGESGLLFEPDNPDELANRMVWMVRHPRIRKAMGTKARENVSEHSLPRVIDRLEQVYQEAIDLNGRK